MDKKNFLLVDDNDDLREILMSLLTTVGYRVHPQKKLQDALDYLRSESQTKFRYGLIELYQYDRQSLDLIKQIRNEFPYIVIIGMAESMDIENNLKVKDCGLHALVYKPFHLEEVLKIYNENS